MDLLILLLKILIGYFPVPLNIDIVLFTLYFEGSGLIFHSECAKSFISLFSLYLLKLQIGEFGILLKIIFPLNFVSHLSILYCPGPGVLFKLIFFKKVFLLILYFKEGPPKPNNGLKL